MTHPRLVASAAEISPKWLNDVFALNKMDATVSGFNQKSIGTGQVGENVRFSLEGTGADLPKSVVGKFVSSNPISKETGIQQQTYTREVFFYQTLQAQVDIDTPRVFFSDIDESHDFVILMEDLAPGIQGDQIEGCSADQCALALEQLGKLHGPVWGSEHLFSYDILSRDDDQEKNGQVKMIYSMVLPAFLERYSHRLSKEHIEVIESMSDLMPAYQKIHQGPKTLVHLDYRLDNMMFGGARPLTVVDWQSISVGCGLMDTSYNLGTSLSSEIRIKQERDLLKVYHDVLKSYGVAISMDECFQLYRSYAPAGLIMAVIASMIVEETERGNDMFMAMAERSCQMVLELDAMDLLKAL